MPIIPWIIALGLMLIGVPVLGILLAVTLALGLRLAMTGDDAQTPADESP